LYYRVIEVLVGAAIDFGGQVTANVLNDEPFLKGIDYAGVVIFETEGFVIGASFGLSTEDVYEIAVRVRISIDYIDKDGLSTINRILGKEKKGAKIAGDIIGEGLGVFGGKVIGDYLY